MAGLSDSGFLAKTLEEILAEIEQFELENIDPSLNVESDSVVGQLNAIMAEQLQELWELAQQVYQSTFPDTAIGIPLSNLAALTGIVRRPATRSIVQIELTGTPTTLIPEGTAVSVLGDSASQFEFTADYTIVTPSSDVVVVTATTPGSATVATTSDTGVIDDPVAGFDSFIFFLNAEVGDDTETDAELRERREIELALPGTGTVNAIRADLLEVDDVDSVTVFENTTDDPTDATGLPIFNIEAVVRGGVGTNEQDIADQLWESKPAGIATFGADSRTVTDSAGLPHTVFFSRPLLVPFQLDFEVVREEIAVTDDQIKDHLVSWALSTLELGEDITVAAIIDQVMSLSGVINVPFGDVLIGRVTPPALNNADLNILDRELGTLAKDKIAVAEAP